jgi:hypothetical protein
MKRVIFYVIIAFCPIISFSQLPAQYKSGETAEDNLNRIINLTPTGTGGMGFDTRYEGIKGSPQFFEKLIPFFVKLSGQDEYLKLTGDLDIYENRLVFNHPKTGNLLSIPALYVTEVIVQQEGNEILFRTTQNYKFDKEMKVIRFFQVMNEGPFQLIKMPQKEYIKADYRNAYSAGRKYDEFLTEYKYFVSGRDSIYHAIQLNKKSLVKILPDKKSLIESTGKDMKFSNDEEMIIYILKRL